MQLFLQEVWKAVQNVLRRPRRTIGGLVAIAVGIAVMLIAGGFIEWMFYGMREWTIHSRLGHIQVMRPDFLERGTSDPFSFLLPVQAPQLETVKDAPHVRAVGERLSFTGLISREDSTASFVGEGVEPEKEELLSQNLVVNRGQNLSAAAPDEIIVGQGLADNLGLSPGDRIVLMTNVTATGSLNAIEVTVRGLFSTVSKEYDDIAIRVPIAAARSLLRTTGSHVWVVLLDDTDRTDDMLTYFNERLDASQFQIVGWTRQADLYMKTVALFSKQVWVLKLIITLLVILSIANTMTMSVTERTREIGTSMALGHTRRRVLRGFVLESFLLGALGACIGLVIGLALATLLSWIGIPMPPPPGMARGYVAQISITGSLARDAMLLALGSATLGGLFPAWKASRMEIVDALRHAA